MQWGPLKRTLRSAAGVGDRVIELVTGSPTLGDDALEIPDIAVRACWVVDYVLAMGLVPIWAVERFVTYAKLADEATTQVYIGNRRVIGHATEFYDLETGRCYAGAEAQSLSVALVERTRIDIPALWRERWHGAEK